MKVGPCPFKSENSHGASKSLQLIQTEIKAGPCPFKSENSQSASKSLQLIQTEMKVGPCPFKSENSQSASKSLQLVQTEMKVGQSKKIVLPCHVGKKTIVKSCPVSVKQGVLVTCINKTAHSSL